MSSNVAMLIYGPLKKKRKDNSFDGNGNVGAKIIVDVLRKSGCEVEFCSPATANKYKLVLVSLTSTYDVISFYAQTHETWKARKFKVLCGGFGMQNFTAIRSIVDYCFFGRAENHIADIVSSIISGNEPDCEHLINTKNPRKVEICQSDLIENKHYSEKHTGCPRKCLFCHYTWARKSTGHDGDYVQNDLTGGGSPELTWHEMMRYDKKIGRGRSAVDGCSERLRFAFGKKITNDEIISGIEHRGSFEGNTVLTVYNIGNMPFEDESDRAELIRVIEKANPKNRVVVVVHTTPFRPSPATPMQWAPASLKPSWHIVGGSFVVKRDNLQVCHSRGNESAYSHLQTLIVERATDKTDHLFHAIATNKKLNSLRSMFAVKALLNEFDISQYTREYDIDEELPTWFLNSYVGIEKQKKIYKSAVKKLMK